MNKGSIRANARALFEYDQLYDQDELEIRKKLTLRLESSYHDLMNRVSILEGTTRTEIIRRALDHYAKKYGDRVLFPKY